jgi:hypothetical protein
MSMSNSSLQISTANKCPACNKEFKSLGDRQRRLVTEHLQYGDLAWLHGNAMNK